MTATDKMQKKGVGNYLYVVVEPSKKGGGKSFYGEIRFPPGGGGQKVRVCIGPYGTAPGQWTLKAATPGNYGRSGGTYRGGRVDTAKNCNPSKRGYFRGVNYSDGSYADLD